MIMRICRKINSALSLKLKYGKSSELEDIKNVITYSARGVYKRIDENRELLELLQNESPAFLKDHFWIEGWLGCQDIFLIDLAQFVPTNDPSIKEGRYPRPWPGRAQNCFYNQTKTFLSNYDPRKNQG